MNASGSKRSYILLEILLSLLIFALAAWICLTLFGAGARASSMAKELENAPTVAASAMERLKTTHTSESTFYDDHWEPVSDDRFVQNPGCYYRVDAICDGTGSYRSGEVVVTRYDRVRKGGELVNASSRQVYCLTTGWIEEEAAR